MSGIIKCDSCGRKVIGQLIGDTLECPSCGEKISEEEFEVLDEGYHEEKTDEAISLEEKLSDKDEEAPTGDVTDEKIAPKKADGVQMNEANTFYVSAQSGRKGIWKVTLEADALTLAAVEGGESIQMLRAHVEVNQVLKEWFSSVFLIFKIEKKEVVFPLEPSHAALFKKWLGPPTPPTIKADGVQMNEANTFYVSATEGRKGIWKVTLEADALTLAAVEGGESIQMQRGDVEVNAVLLEWFFLVFLIFKIEKKKVGFKLEPSHAALFKKWLGPPTIRGLKVALKKRLKWCLPIGILFVFTSIPFPANPEAGLEAVPFDAVSAFLGASLIAITILARIWFRRILFLLDGVWLSLLALDATVGIFRGDSLWWAISVIALILGAKGGFSEYQRFASVPHH